MCFVWISEQTAIISLYSYSIHRLVCITETVCVYCAVRTGSLNYVFIRLNYHICEVYSLLQAKKEPFHVNLHGNSEPAGTMSHGSCYGSEVSVR